MKPMTRSVLCVAIVSTFACNPAKPTQDAVLTVTPKPKTLSDQGTPTDLRIQTQDEFGRPGKGSVTVSAPFGSFDNGTTEVIVQVDSAGVGWATYRCSVYDDDRCTDGVTLTAEWKNAAAVSLRFKTLGVETQLPITGCGPISKAKAPIVRRCAPATDNECDGPTDVFLAQHGVPGDRVNQGTGNGFDDDCDGLADEGCACPQSGQTKPCRLVPATQTDPQGNMVGWCSKNALGSVDCSAVGDTTKWSGVCRGAQQPTVNDSCATGDFNCDGLDRNNAVQGCRCKTLDVKCPQEPLTVAPFPDPGHLPFIDGSQWIVDPALRTQVTGWQWAAIGGDCDNVLPNPTFALFRGPDTRVAGARVGSKSSFMIDSVAIPPRLVSDGHGAIKGVLANSNAAGIIYPAFALSGDYLVQGQFTYDQETYSCTQKVQVRAPGVRVELCWDMDGGSRDVDLHVARTFGACSSNAWDNECDCNYKNTSANWGYSSSPGSACSGWGSTSGGSSDGGNPCNNPRLDKDNISCNLGQTDPNGMGFCAPENINIDQPNDDDSFVVMANFFSGSKPTPLHVNMYCNGERVASIGANPASGAGFPRLLKSGGDSKGDIWTAATLKTHVRAGVLESCTVESVPSRIPDSTRDGNNAYCVDASATPSTPGYGNHQFIEAGTSQGLPAGELPTARAQWCKH